MRSKFIVGLDVGQSCDYTALAIVERAELRGPWNAEVWAYRKMAGLRLRYLERVELGTPYPEVVERVRVITRSAELRGQCSLVVDATGVGRAIVDLLRGADLECWVLPAVITSGLDESQSKGYYHVPKKNLIVGLEVLLQRGGLRIAQGMAYGATLVEEMRQMRAKRTARGHEQYGAWREGEHDDLVFAVALAQWGAEKVWGRVSGDDGVWRYEGELG